MDELLKFTRLRIAAMGLEGRVRAEIRVAGYGRNRVAGVAILGDHDHRYFCRDRDYVTVCLARCRYG